MPHEDHLYSGSAIENWVANTATKRSPHRRGSPLHRNSAAKPREFKQKTGKDKKRRQRKGEQASRAPTAGNVRPVGRKEHHDSVNRAVLRSSESELEEAASHFLQQSSGSEIRTTSNKASLVTASPDRTKPRPRDNKNVFERRARHKTRVDRYEPKAKSKQRGRPVKKHTNHESGRRKRTTKSGANMMHDFEASNVATERITLKPTKKHGIFGNGKASSPVKRKPLGDLVFSELDFLNKRRHRETLTPDDDKRRKRCKEREHVIGDAEISRYFGSHSRADNRLAPQHVGRTAVAMPNQTGENGPPTNVDLPTTPFLGFGSSGSKSISSKKARLKVQPKRQASMRPGRPKSRSTSYFTWTKSRRSSEADDSSRSPDSCLNGGPPPKCQKPSLPAPVSPIMNGENRTLGRRGNSKPPDLRTVDAIPDVRQGEINEPRQSSCCQARHSSGQQQRGNLNNFQFKQHERSKVDPNARSRKLQRRNSSPRFDDLPTQSLKRLLEPLGIEHSSHIGGTQPENKENPPRCQVEVETHINEVDELSQIHQIDLSDPGPLQATSRWEDLASLDKPPVTAVSDSQSGISRLQRQELLSEHRDQPLGFVATGQISPDPVTDSHAARPSENQSIRSRRAEIAKPSNKHLALLQPLFLTGHDRDAGPLGPMNGFVSQRLEETRGPDVSNLRTLEAEGRYALHPAFSSTTSSRNSRLQSVSTRPTSVWSRSSLPISSHFSAQRSSGLTPFPHARLSRGISVADSTPFARNALDAESKRTANAENIMWQQNIEATQFDGTQNTASTSARVSHRMSAPADAIDMGESLDQDQQVEAEMVRFWIPNNLY